jgi:hypothetical protein
MVMTTNGFVVDPVAWHMVIISAACGESVGDAIAVAEAPRIARPVTLKAARIRFISVSIHSLVETDQTRGKTATAPT